MEMRNMFTHQNLSHDGKSAFMPYLDGISEKVLAGASASGEFVIDMIPEFRPKINAIMDHISFLLDKESLEPSNKSVSALRHMFENFADKAPELADKYFDQLILVIQSKARLDLVNQSLETLTFENQQQFLDNQTELFQDKAARQSDLDQAIKLARGFENDLHIQCDTEAGLGDMLRNAFGKTGAVLGCVVDAFEWAASQPARGLIWGAGQLFGAGYDAITYAMPSSKALLDYSPGRTYFNDSPVARNLVTLAVAGYFPTSVVGAFSRLLLASYQTTGVARLSGGALSDFDKALRSFYSDKGISQTAKFAVFSALKGALAYYFADDLLSKHAQIVDDAQQVAGSVKGFFDYVKEGYDSLHRSLFGDGLQVAYDSAIYVPHSSDLSDTDALSRALNALKTRGFSLDELRDKGLSDAELISLGKLDDVTLSALSVSNDGFAAAIEKLVSENFSDATRASADSLISAMKDSGLENPDVQAKLSEFLTHLGEDTDSGDLVAHLLRRDIFTGDDSPAAQCVSWANSCVFTADEIGQMNITNTSANQALNYVVDAINEHSPELITDANRGFLTASSSLCGVGDLRIPVMLSMLFSIAASVGLDCSAIKNHVYNNILKRSTTTSTTTTTTTTTTIPTTIPTTPATVIVDSSSAPIYPWVLAIVLLSMTMYGIGGWAGQHREAASNASKNRGRTLTQTEKQIKSKAQKKHNILTAFYAVLGAPVSWVKLFKEYCIDDRKSEVSAFEDASINTRGRRQGWNEDAVVYQAGTHSL